MPVNADFQGRTYPPTEPYRVGAAKIREFAEAVGADDPVHTDVEVARAGDVLGQGDAHRVAPAAARVPLQAHRPP